MKLISRGIAAKRLGVTPSSISNYVKNKMLTSVVRDGRLYIDEESLEKYSEKIHVMEAEEKALEDRLRELKAENEAANMALIDIRNKELKGKSPMTIESIIDLAEALALSDSRIKLGTRDMSILKTFLRGKDDVLTRLSELHSITPERVRQIINRAFRRLRLQVLDVGIILDTNRELMRENNELKERVASMQSICDEYQDLVKHEDELDLENIHEPPFLKKKITDVSLSVRTLNVLQGNFYIEEVKDLLTEVSNMNQLMRCRNFGRRCCVELQEFMDEYGLIFKGEKESYPHFLARLNKSMKDKEMENQKKKNLKTTKRS